MSKTDNINNIKHYCIGFASYAQIERTLEPASLTLFTQEPTRYIVCMEASKILVNRESDIG